VGDDLESDIAGGQQAGLRTVLVRTGKFRADALTTARVAPDVVLDSLAALPDWLEGE
jgi:ribonucleotide monophosphatase NagD (HAD superfamily)